MARDTAITAQPTWKPLGNKCPKHWLPAEEAKHKLHPKQIHYIQYLVQLLAQNDPQAAEQGIAMLDAIPRIEEQRLDLVNLRAEFLKVLDQSYAAYGLLLDHIFTTEDERLWCVRGHLVLQWLLHPPSEDIHAQLSQALAHTCEQTQLRTPRLLRAFLLSQSHVNPPPEAIALYADTLNPESWKQALPHLDPWAEHLATGFFVCIQHELQHQNLATARQYGQMMLRFPWHTYTKGFTPRAMQMLCSALTQAHMDAEQKQLCTRILRKYPQWGEPHFWLGRLALQEGRTEEGLASLRKAIQMGPLEDHQTLFISRTLLDHQCFAEVSEFLAHVQDKTSREYLHIELLLALYQEHLEAALDLCQRILAHTPNDRRALLTRCSLLHSLGRWDEVKAEVQPWLDCQDRPLQMFANLFLGDIALQTQKPQEALAYFQQLLHPPNTYDTLFSPHWQWSFLLSLGECLEKNQRPEEAIERYQEALSIAPSGSLYLRLIWLYLQHQQYREAKTLLSPASHLLAQDPWFLYAMAQIAEHFEDWPTCLQAITQLDPAWLHTQDLLKQGLLTQMRATFACQTPWQALLSCEPYLLQFAQDAEFLALRKSIVDATTLYIEAMETQLSEQQRQLQHIKDSHQQLLQRQKQHQQRETIVTRILQQNPLQRQWHNAPDAPLPSPRRDAKTSSSPQDAISARYDALSTQLPPQYAKLLQNAALFWHTLHEYPNEDHGPIIIQLARIIEAEVNIRLIDPLVQFAISQETPLSSLPSPSIRALAPSGNRLSLGDAAMMLYHKLTQREPDGSTTNTRNPRSNDVHRDLLKAFWGSARFRSLPASTQRTLREQLPQHLQTLSKWRNQASHAHQSPIVRSDALAIQNLVLGSPSEPGLLELFLTLPTI